jgi:hypothetical protein
MSIGDSEAYKEFETRHNRYLNMLQENDRNLRRQALNEFKKACENQNNKEVLQLFYIDKLCKRLVLCLEDQVEKNRELTIEIITTCIEKVGLKEEA